MKARRVDLVQSKPFANNEKVEKSSPSVRLNLLLSNTTTDSFPEFSYVELLQNALEEKENPFATKDKEENDKLVDIAKHFEAKYKKRNTTWKKGKKRRERDEDLIDMGAGYDLSDSFVDDSELYDELVPQCCTPQHGGFYINTGKLDVIVSDDSDSEVFVPQLIKRKRKKINLSQTWTDDEAPIEERHVESKADMSDDGIAKKKKRLSSMGNGIGTVADDKLAIVNNNNNDKQTNSDPTTWSQLELSSSDEEDLFNTECQKKIWATDEGMNEAIESVVRQMSATESAKIVVRQILDRPSNAGNNSGDIETHNGNDSSRSPVLKGSSTKRQFSVDDGAVGSPDVRPIASADEMEGHVSETDVKPKPVPLLPENLPPKLVTTISKLKEAAAQPKTGKSKFFTPYVNDLLLEVENLRANVPRGSKMAIYDYLETFLPCGKLTLMKRAKALRQNFLLQSSIGEPLTRLREAIEKVMPEQIVQYESALAVAKTAFFNKLKANHVEGDHVPDELLARFKPPNKTFVFTDEIRQLLEEIIRLKVDSYSSVDGPLEDFVLNFIRTELVSLWPHQWMHTKVLYNITQSVHQQGTGERKDNEAVVKKRGKPPKTESPAASRTVGKVLEKIEREAKENGEKSVECKIELILENCTNALVDNEMQNTSEIKSNKLEPKTSLVKASSKFLNDTYEGKPKVVEKRSNSNVDSRNNDADCVVSHVQQFASGESSVDNSVKELTVTAFAATVDLPMEIPAEEPVEKGNNKTDLDKLAEQIRILTESSPSRLNNDPHVYLEYAFSQQSLQQHQDHKKQLKSRRLSTTDKKDSVVPHQMSLNNNEGSLLGGVSSSSLEVTSSALLSLASSSLPPAHLNNGHSSPECKVLPQSQVLNTNLYDNEHSIDISSKSQLTSETKTSPQSKKAHLLSHLMTNLQSHCISETPGDIFKTLMTSSNAHSKPSENMSALYSTSHNLSHSKTLNPIIEPSQALSEPLVVRNNVRRSLPLGTTLHDASSLSRQTGPLNDFMDVNLNQQNSTLPNKASTFSRPPMSGVSNTLPSHTKVGSLHSQQSHQQGQISQLRDEIGVSYLATSPSRKSSQQPVLDFSTSLSKNNNPAHRQSSNVNTQPTDMIGKYMQQQQQQHQIWQPNHESPPSKHLQRSPISASSHMGAYVSNANSDRRNSVSSIDQSTFLQTYQDAAAASQRQYHQSPDLFLSTATSQTGNHAISFVNRSPEQLLTGGGSYGQTSIISDHLFDSLQTNFRQNDPNSFAQLQATLAAQQSLLKSHGLTPPRFRYDGPY